eukprot:CAMPEP_0178695806 /NCGR_PEP_ID=MMETSP0699-20121125/9067_1 /TAXON_ID=265572 /ORGANISM="Extubocellulus spinifer, Strain CCMP396" /LENGTH=316 /DNA_ID=CAMNT_0020341559 /DNA_START=92 /DNA_END=1042 /DNA_ORIENTATION=-
MSNSAASSSVDMHAMTRKTYVTQPVSSRLLCPLRRTVVVFSDQQQHRCIRRIWLQQKQSSSNTTPKSSTTRSGTSDQVSKDDRNEFSTTSPAEVVKGDGGVGPPPLSEPTSKDLVCSIAEQMKSIPNIITLSRIASTPFISHLIITEQYPCAVGGCIAFGLTDWLDGYIAKNYRGQSTVLGTYLDPLADKIMVNTLAMSLWYNTLLPGPVVGIWLARDVGLIVTSYGAVSRATKTGNAIINPATTPLKVKPTVISKINTALQFLTITGGMAQALFGLSPDVVMGLCWITGGTTIVSGLGYVGGRSMVASGNRKVRE